MATGELPRIFSLRLSANGSEDDIARMLVSPNGSTEGSNSRMKAALRLAAGMPAVQALGPEGAIMQALIREELEHFRAEMVAEMRRLLSGVQVARVPDTPPQAPSSGRFDNSTVDEG